MARFLTVTDESDPGEIPRGMPFNQALAQLRAYHASLQKKYEEARLHLEQQQAEGKPVPAPDGPMPPPPPIVVVPPPDENRKFWTKGAFWSAIAATASLLTALLALILGFVKPGGEGGDGRSPSVVTGTITSTVMGTVTVSVVGTPSMTVTVTVPPTLTPGQKN